MQVFFEADRLIFQPDDERDRADLADWWAQLQDCDGKPLTSSCTAEKALILYLPQR